MKKIFVTLVIVFVCNVSFAQIPSNLYSDLTPGYNYANNQIAMNYNNTRYLPSGWQSQTVSELCRKNNAIGLWAEFDVASPTNRRVDNGIYVHPKEEILISPNGKLNSAKTCGNYIVRYSYIYGGSPVVVKTEKVDLSETNALIGQTNEGIHDLKQGQNILWQQNDEIKKQNDYIIAQNERIIKQNKTSNTLGVVNTVLNTADLTVGVINLVKRRKGNTYNYYRRTTNNNYYRPATTTTPGQEGHHGNGLYSLIVGNN